MAQPKVAQKKRIFWDAVDVPDLVEYRVYWEKSPGELNYETTPHISIPKTKTEAFVPDDFFGVTFEEDIDYNIWVTSVDDAGNEAPLALVGQFDFTPPPAPTNGGIESIF